MGRALALAGALVGTIAWAQQGTGVITGKVVSAADKSAVVDVVVTATSPSLQGEQVVVTDETGLYRIPQLPPGEYTLRFEKESMRPYERRGIKLRIDTTLRVNVELLPEELQAEEVVVTGRAPTIDVGSAQAGVTIDEKFIRNLAVVRPGSKNSAQRSFESLAEFAPGAKADAYGVSIAGATSPENQFVIDGVSVNDPSNGTLGTPLSVEFIKEVNIITGGYLPEYGRATGGVMNAVTKSGSNEFHGSVWGNWAPGLLQGTPKTIGSAASVISGTGRAWNLGDFGAELGGPILKDKLWFYAGIAPAFTRVAIDQQFNAFQPCTAEDVANNVSGCSSITGRKTDPITGNLLGNPIPGTETRYFADERTIQYIAKLTYLINSDHNVALTVYGNPVSSGGDGKFSFNREGNPEVCTGLSCRYNGDFESYATRRGNAAFDMSAKYSGSFLEKKLLTDVTLSWHRQDAYTRPSDGSAPGSAEGLAGSPRTTWRANTMPQRTIFTFRDFDDQGLCGSTPEERARLCPAGSYLTGGPGTINDTTLSRYQGRAVVSYLATLLGHHILKAGVDVEAASLSSTRARTGGYFLLEDTGGNYWEIGSRYGYMEDPNTPVYLDTKVANVSSLTWGTFLQDSWQVLDLFTINAGFRYDDQSIRDENGQVALSLANQWSPRIGFIYDFTQEGRSKIYGSYARYYENVPLLLADISFPQQQLITARVRSSACNPLNPGDLDGPCQDDANKIAYRNPEDPSQLYNGEGGDNAVVDPEIRAQSNDEWQLGAEYEVLQGRLGARYVRRSLIDVVEDMSRDDGNTYFFGNPGKGFATDFPVASRNYDEFSLYYTKPFGDLWLAQASYTWSFLRGNYNGMFRSDNNQLDPNVTRDFDLPILMVNRTGPLANDVTHYLKLFGAKEFLLGQSTSVNLGLGYTARSGTPISYRALNPRRSGNETYVLPRGEAGRLPWIHNFDAHVGFNQKLPGGYTLSLTADVFNVFNSQQVTAVDEQMIRVTSLPLENGETVGDIQGCFRTGGDFSCPVQKANGAPVAEGDINPNFKNPIAYQNPISVRLGARLSF